MPDKEFEMNQAFRVPEAQDALPLEQQVLLQVFEGALDTYRDLEAVKRLATVQFVNYLSAQALTMVFNQQIDKLLRNNIALQLERRELLLKVIEQGETIQSLAREAVDLAKELEDLRQDW